MARVNPSALPVVKERRITRTFEDPEQEEPLTLTLRRRHTLELAEWMGQATQWAEDFAGGVPIDGETKHITENSWNIIALLCACQVPDAGEEAYSTLEWLYLFERYPTAMQEVVKAVNELQGTASKNSSTNSGKA